MLGHIPQHIPAVLPGITIGRYHRNSWCGSQNRSRDTLSSCSSTLHSTAATHAAFLKSIPTESTEAYTVTQRAEPDEPTRAATARELLGAASITNTVRDEKRGQTQPISNDNLRQRRRSSLALPVCMHLVVPAPTRERSHPHSQASTPTSR